MKILMCIMVCLLLIISCDNKKGTVVTDNAAVTDNEVTTDEISETGDEVINDEPADSDLLIDDVDTAPACGNGIIEGTEVCDKDTKNCVDIDSTRYLSGTGTCKADCTGYDVTKCVRACTDGRTQCNVNVLQTCSNKTWNDTQDCSETTLKCLPKASSGGGGQTSYECRELGKDNKCTVLLACANTCAGDTACIAECEAGGTEAAKQYYENLAACGAKNCAGQTGSTLTTCLRNSCPTEYQTCRNDAGVQCGNGFVEGSEECDDGNLSAGDGCSIDCKNEAPGVCGNSTIESGEQCDDGGIIAGDGCSDKCQIEYDSRFDFTGPDYTGDSLLIINTSPNSSNMSSSGAIPPAVLKMSVTPESSATGLPNLFINPHFKAPEGLTLDDLYQPEMYFLPAEGDTQQFYVMDATGQSVTQITATLVKIASHVQIWAANSSFATADQLQAIADEFDNVIFPLVTTNFAEPSDVNADGTISLLFTDLGTTIAGYFSPGDLYTKTQYPQSNQRDMIFVSTRNSLTKAGAYAVITHEFQHLCFNNRNAIVEGDTQGVNSNGNIWINEGLSMTAMHLYNGIQSDWIAAYNQTASLTTGQSLTYWNDTNTADVYGNYALSYLFFEYLRIQGGNHTEMFREIVEDKSNDYRCVENAIRKHVGAGLSFSDFDTNFRLALLLNDATGTFGFGGESGFTINKKYYTGTAAVNLRGTGALYKQISGSFTEPADKGKLTKYVGVKTE